MKFSLRRWILFTGVTISLATQMASAQMRPVPMPVPPSPPAASPPNCPVYLMGQVDGVYYYGTSNCIGLSGYGQSNVKIPVPQCVSGSCGTPISIIYSNPPVLLKQTDSPQQGQVSPDSVEDWIREIKEKRDELQSAATNRPMGDGRRQRIDRILPFLQKTIEFLENPRPTAGDKQMAKERYDEQIALHLHGMERIGLAGEDPQRFAVGDKQISGSPKAAADTNFVTSSVLPANVTVNVSKLNVLKVETSAGAFSYFQTFLVEVRSSRASQNIDLRLGVEVTADGLTSTTDAEFSERGEFAHRIRTKAGAMPFLVNGYSNLGP
jgi:hypothetical protein